MCVLWILVCNYVDVIWMGGEEFLVLLLGVGCVVVVVWFEDFWLKVVVVILGFGIFGLNVLVSIGLVVLCVDSDDLVGLLCCVDYVMYCVKCVGCN